MGKRAAVSEGHRGFSAAPPGIGFNMVCPAAREAGCSLRAAAVEAAPRRNGLKESLTECEINTFLSLARGHRIAVRDHETGHCGAGGWTCPFPTTDSSGSSTTAANGICSILACTPSGGRISREPAPASAGKPATAPGSAAAHASAHPDHAHLRRVPFHRSH